jgi:hypothetical protein
MIKPESDPTQTQLIIYQHGYANFKQTLFASNKKCLPDEDYILVDKVETPDNRRCKIM